MKDNNHAPLGEDKKDKWCNHHIVELVDKDENGPIWECSVCYRHFNEPDKRSKK